MSAAREAATVLAVDDETAASVKARRTRLGMSVQALAREAHVDRGRLAALEKGDPSVRSSTIGAVEAALSRLEQEIGMDAPSTASNEIEFRVSGNFGVDVVVRGPVTDLAALEASVARLVSQMQSNESDNRQ